jgi:hypothetical protein
MLLEWIMLVCIGFMAGCLSMLTIIPLVHDRAVRLTAKKHLASTPLSVEEMQAEKDLLRAEFAMSNRRLELTVEEVRAKALELLREVGVKAAEIHRLKTELAKTANPNPSLRSALRLLTRA